MEARHGHVLSNLSFLPPQSVSLSPSPSLCLSLCHLLPRLTCPSLCALCLCHDLSQCTVFPSGCFVRRLLSSLTHVDVISNLRHVSSAGQHRPYHATARDFGASRVDELQVLSEEKGLFFCTVNRFPVHPQDQFCSCYILSDGVLGSMF